MEYTTLGASGLRISRLGLGCWAIGGHGYGRTDDAESIRVVHTALDVGIDFFDTADVYGFGHSETILGAALGSRRHDVIVATKFGVAWDARGATWRDSSPAHAVQALEDSLRRLRLDSVPLYQIHWHDGSTPLEATIEALVRCQESGKIKHFGCSNVTPAMIRRAAHIGRVASAQFRYSVLHNDAANELADCVHELSVGTIVFGVLGRALLTGTLATTVGFDDRDTRRDDADFQGERLADGLRLADRLRLVGRECGRTAAQVAIRWALDDPNVSCALVGAKTSDQLRENVGAMGWRLDPTAREQLAAPRDVALQARPANA